MIALFMGIVDEWYAEDVRQHVLDYQERRRQSGLTIGTWPFGTIRQDGTVLRPSPFGVWLLTDSTLKSGQRDEVPPQSDALWRGYYDAAHATLELYSQNAMGLNRIAHELRHQGWFYRSSRGQPKLPEADDVRRVIAAWPQYAGLVVIGASKSRRRNVKYFLNRYYVRWPGWKMSVVMWVPACSRVKGQRLCLPAARVGHLRLL